MSHKGNVITICDTCNKVIEDYTIVFYSKKFFFNIYHFCSIKCFLNNKIIEEKYTNEIDRLPK